LELARSEREVARVDLVAERLADLRDAERDRLARSLAHALEVVEDRLARLRAQVGHLRALLGGADLGREHQVEAARLGEVVLGRALSRAARRRVGELIGAEALLAGAAVDHRVAEVLDVTRRLPGPRVRDDRAVDALDVGALAHDPLPPERLQVLLELGAERPVVPEAVDPAIDLAGREDEAAARAQRDEIIHPLEAAALRRLVARHGSSARERRIIRGLRGPCDPGTAGCAARRRRGSAGSDSRRYAPRRPRAGTGSGDRGAGRRARARGRAR